MISMATAVKDPRERLVQETLEAVTWPGETLLGFTQCRLNPGELLDKTYCVGLTPRRFIMVCKGEPERVYSIYRCLVEQAQFVNGGLIRPSGLELKLGGERVLLETVQPWDQRTLQIVELHKDWELESPYLTSTQFLESITDLMDLGLQGPAQRLLRKHMAEDPVVEIEPRSAELDFELDQRRWALRLSLGTLAFALLYSLGRVIFGAAWAGADLLPVILLLLAAIELVQRRQAWRGLALGFALLAALLNLAYSGISGSVLNGSLWTSFAATNILALTGTPRRSRGLLATAIFAIGFLGPLIFAGAAAAIEPQARFTDDFSADQGWVRRDNSTLTSGVQNGAYEVHVKETNSVFMAFPPIHFTPVQVSFDATVPDGFTALVGTYGVTCGYSDWSNSYLVEIDPTGEHYAFLLHDGKHFRPLTNQYWQPVTGTRLIKGTTHVEVGCASRKMTLKINGVEQGEVSVPGFSWFGKMGLFVRTWPDTGSRGFEVLFDNVDFQKRSMAPW